MFGAVVTNDPFLIVDHARDQSIRPLVISCEILLVKPYGKWIFGWAATRYVCNEYVGSNTCMII